MKSTILILLVLALAFGKEELNYVTNITENME